MLILEEETKLLSKLVAFYLECDSVNWAVSLHVGVMLQKRNVLTLLHLRLLQLFPVKILNGITKKNSHDYLISNLFVIILDCVQQLMIIFVKICQTAE